MTQRRPYWNSLFSHVASAAAHGMGHPIGFVSACLVIVAWAATGPLFGFSDTWQLVINTSTTIVTFLVVFLIQNTQNRESAAIQIKLDELIRSVRGAHNALLDLEELTDQDLVEIRRQYLDLAREARADLRKGRKDTGVGRLSERTSAGP
jgi:low affinity Fe/Cu permease